MTSTLPSGYWPSDSTPGWRGRGARGSRSSPLSSNSVHVIAENSGHYIQWEASRVVAAVREVVTAALTLALLR